MYPSLEDFTIHLDNCLIIWSRLPSPKRLNYLIFQGSFQPGLFYGGMSHSILSFLCSFILPYPSHRLKQSEPNETLLHYQTKHGIFAVIWNTYSTFQDDERYSFSDFFPDAEMKKPPLLFSKALSLWGNWEKHH